MLLADGWFRDGCKGEGEGWLARFIESKTLGDVGGWIDGGMDGGIDTYILLTASGRRSHSLPR